MSLTVRALADRKRWARATSKRLKHSRAYRDVLAHLAFRAGSGRMWDYSLKQIAAEVEVVEKTVRRALASFKDQGIIAIKKKGPSASEYTINFEDESVAKEWTFCPP